jgi:hypothetical protein
LGQTKETNDTQTAINLFLEREFPQLLKCQTEPHEAFLIPDSFIYGGIAAKVILPTSLQNQFEYCIIMISQSKGEG